MLGWPTTIRALLGCSLAALSIIASAAEPLILLTGKTPEETVLLRWQHSLLAGDWEEYSAVVVPVLAIPLEVRKSQFQALREWTPEVLKMTPPTTLPNGNLRFFVLGCAKGRRQAAGVILVKAEGTWLVSGAGWGDVWSPDVKKCPV
jgi:hypothetical protein